MAGVLLAVRRRNPQGDRAGVIDALIITVGIALLSWVFLMAPYVHDATLSPLAKSVSIAFRSGMCSCWPQPSVSRLTGDVAAAPSSYWQRAWALSSTTDAAYGYALLDGTHNHQLIYDFGWLVYYLLWGAAALHPSMREFVEATPDRQRRLSWQRLGLLTAASLVAPVIELVREGRRGDFDLLVIVAASIVVFLLVIARVVGLVKQNERTVKRERALRLANLALVQATAPAEIGEAALRAAEELVEDAGEVRLCVQRPAGLVLLTTEPSEDAVLSLSTASLLDWAAATPGEQVALPDGVCAEVGLTPGHARAHVFPLAARADQRGVLIAAAPSPFSPILVAALDGLCASVSMALESAALSEQTHRRENEARFASLSATRAI